MNSFKINYQQFGGVSPTVPVVGIVIALIVTAILIYFFIIKPNQETEDDTFTDDEKNALIQNLQDIEDGLRKQETALEELQAIFNSIGDTDDANTISQGISEIEDLLSQAENLISTLQGTTTPTVTTTQQQQQSATPYTVDPSSIVTQALDAINDYIDGLNIQKTAINNLITIYSSKGLTSHVDELNSDLDQINSAIDQMNSLSTQLQSAGNTTPTYTTTGQ